MYLYVFEDLTAVQMKRPPLKEDTVSVHDRLLSVIQFKDGVYSQLEENGYWEEIETRTPLTQLTKNQSYTDTFTHPDEGRLDVCLRYDDFCGNGQNTFSITAVLQDRNGREIACGCLHDEIRQHAPKYAEYIKWHLCSSNGPLHYIANSLYLAGRAKWESANLENLRSTAIWPEADEKILVLPMNELTTLLRDRLPALLDDFREAMESLGFTY